MSNALLLICDNPDQAVSIRNATAAMYEIEMLNSYQGAEHYLQQHPLPSLILIATNTPNPELSSFISLIRSSSHWKDLSVLILSFTSENEAIHYVYSIGADDYLPMPVDPKLLLFKIEALLTQHRRMQQLASEYEQRLSEATRAAITAMRTSSDIGTVVGFVNESFKMGTYPEIAKHILSVISSLGLQGCVEIRIDDDIVLASSSGVPSPVEREIIEIGRGKRRIISKDKMTLINYPNLSLLVKNMPVEDMELAGRYSDLLCQLADAAQSRVRSIRFESIVVEQSFRATGVVELIKQNSQDNLVHVHNIMNSLLEKVQASLSFLGLTEQQELIILTMIEGALKDLDDLHDNNVVLENHCMRMVTEMQKALTSSGRSTI